MPFAGYENFKDCVTKNQDKENPEAYCAVIMRKVEKEIQEGHYMGRNLDPDYMNVIIGRYDTLKNRGIPEPEIERAIMSEYAYGSHFNDPWPPRPTGGFDTVDHIYSNLIPAGPFPPYEGQTDHGTLTGMDQIETPDELAIFEEVGIPGSLSGISIGAGHEVPSSKNWVGTAATTIGGPSMHGEEAAANQRREPEEAWFPWGDNLKEAGQPPTYARYKYNGHELSEFCKTFDGMVFDVNQKAGRPVLPSESLGYTTQHPNCQCTWEYLDPILSDDITPSDLLGHQKEHLSSINRLIGQKARYGSLHLVDHNGRVIDGTIDFNPRNIMETVGNLKKEFKWMTPKYLEGLISKNWPGKVYLIRAAAETETDHRIEGEQYKRKLDGLELLAMARTATGKSMDINHNPQWKTGAVVLDSEGDPIRKEIQMAVLETDPEIIAGIDRGDIQAVSINGGAPRSEEIAPCSSTGGELCSHPRGVILGENDGIALTWVVTNPRGFIWKGQRIPPAEPGVKVTKIEALT